MNLYIGVYAPWCTQRLWAQHTEMDSKHIKATHSRQDEDALTRPARPPLLLSPSPRRPGQRRALSGPDLQGLPPGRQGSAARRQGRPRGGYPIAPSLASPTCRTSPCATSHCCRALYRRRSPSSPTSRASASPGRPYRGPFRPSWTRSRSSPSSSSPSTRSPAPSRRRWAIPNLSGINLSRNRLTGAIPMFLSKSADQVYLWLSHNNLTGPLPAGFAAVNFAHLDLSRNALTSDALGLFGRGKELRYMDLSRNDFDFDLSAVVLPEQIYTVDLSHNAIHGSIPAQVASAANLNFFNVSYNRLCGCVPTGGNMARFDVYSF